MLVCLNKLPRSQKPRRARLPLPEPTAKQRKAANKFIRHQNAIDAAPKMEQPSTVNIAGVEVPIRGLPENDAPAVSQKKPPPKKQVLFCGYCEQACRKVLRCSKCKSVAYCGVDCQRRAWPNHKKRCVPPRHTKSLCACCGALSEVANCDALVAVGASTPCRVCGRVEVKVRAPHAIDATLSPYRVSSIT